MQIQKITLADGLKHHKYNWPLTLLSYPIELEAKNPETSVFQLTDENGNNIPFQISDVDKSSDEGISAKLYFIADMPYGSNHTYTLSSSETFASTEAGGILIDDSKDDVIKITSNKIRLVINKNIMNAENSGCHIFSIGSINNGAIGDAYISSLKIIDGYTVDFLKKGPVFADCAITVQFTDGSLYKVTLRLTQEMDFFELSEETKGFTKEDSAKLNLVWSNFNPQKRYVHQRYYEEIDKYIEDGYLPFKMVPYASSVNWRRSKLASFTDTGNNTTVGIFVKNSNSWDNGEYALWGSSDKNAISFRYDLMQDMEGELCFEYPLVTGTRCTAIAVYAGKKDEQSPVISHIYYLWIWYEFINLNKVKDWALRWHEDKNPFPRFFPNESIPAPGVMVWHYGVRKEPFAPAFMDEIIYKLSNNMNNLIKVGSVASREFFDWAYVFDMAAPKMTQNQFDDFKACFAFMTYLHISEAFLSIEGLLSGHPNFLSDVRSVAAIAASLFPSHPHAQKWVDQFEKAMARNMKYHIRPDVKAWNSKGGRWTENLSCYVFASLIPMMKTSALVYKTFGDNILMYPGIEKWADWMINSLTAPVNGERTYPQQGAHSGVFLDPIIPTSSVWFFAERLFNYRPLLAEALMYISSPNAPGHEEHLPGSDIYKYLYDSSLKTNNGTKSQLKSSKYTGYGYVLRSAVNEESEVSVHLTQIDEGPNYRWGEAAQGGCGVIYYNAAGYRYSYNRSEDVGDANMGDVQACCNFGVMIGHEFKSVGRNELTEPMYDFGFAQYAQLNASDYSQPFYKSRSVILSGNDYMIVYDKVGEMRVRGRFAWFVSENESFPDIAQLKPGVKGVYVEPGIAADTTEKNGNNKRESKGIVFDGFGDFLTVVTHRKLNCDYNTYTKKTEYGAEIRMQGRTDMVFRDGSLIRYKGFKSSFVGYAGIVRQYEDSYVEAAIFRGTKIEALGTEVSLFSLKGEAIPAAGISFKTDFGRLIGKVICSEAIRVSIKLSEKYKLDKYKLFINYAEHEIEMTEDTLTFVLGEGAYTWEWTDKLPVPEDTEIIKTIVSSESVELFWKNAGAAEHYTVEISKDGEKNFETAIEEISGNTCKLVGLENGAKIHLRVKSSNKDNQSEWSSDYPVYVTEKLPVRPEGLKVWKWRDVFKVLWGWQLGVDRYKLYKREKGTDSFTLIYEGQATEYIDYETCGKTEVFEYCASAINGNGEGEKSLIRDTAPDGLAFWDPEPGKGFRRYTKSHEYGHNGFDHWGEALKGDLSYPD